MMAVLCHVSPDLRRLVLKIYQMLMVVKPRSLYYPLYTHVILLTFQDFYFVDRRRTFLLLSSCKFSSFQLGPRRICEFIDGERLILCASEILV